MNYDMAPFQDTDYGFSEVSIDKDVVDDESRKDPQEKRKTRFKESSESLDSDDAEVRFVFEIDEN